MIFYYSRVSVRKNIFNYKTYIMRKKGGIGTLLLAGAAAFAYYKYSKMSEEQKRNMVNGIKEKGKRFYDESVPQNVKNIFSKSNGTPSHAQSQNM